MPEKPEKLFLKKPNQTVTISNGEITVSQRKAYNVLLHSALQSLRLDGTKTDFLISVAEIEEKAGIQDTNNKRLKENLENLMNVKVRCIRENDDWETFVLLARIKKEGNLLRFELPSPVRESLIRNDYYTALDLMIIKALKSKYAVILYEIALRYNKVEIPRYTIGEFKKLTGTESYNNFNNLKKFCIKPAIAEINEKTDIEMDCEIFRTGRKVTEIKFRVKHKPHICISENGQAARNSGNVKEEIQAADSMEAGLISLKLSRKQAQALLKKYPEDRIRRNIDLTLKKAGNGEVVNIPAFLTEAIREDYAKDYDPAAEKYQQAVSEAKTCWQKCRGQCEAVWISYIDDKFHACHWCRKFAEQRKAEIQGEKPPQSSPESSDPEPLFEIIPVKATEPLRSLVREYCQAKGSEYVKQGIEHVNQNISDKRKYRAALEKRLAGNQAGAENREPQDKQESIPGTQPSEIPKTGTVRIKGREYKLREGCAYMEKGVVLPGTLAELVRKGEAEIIPV